MSTQAHPTSLATSNVDQTNEVDRLTALLEATIKESQGFQINMITGFFYVNNIDVHISMFTYRCSH